MGSIGGGLGARGGGVFGLLDWGLDSLGSPSKTSLRHFIKISHVALCSWAQDPSIGTHFRV
eukprot:1161400-Pelagomonas_calceolata.AAC.7